MKKYRSEIDEALHGDILGLFEIGVISEAELREFEADAFVGVVSESEVFSEVDDADEVAEEPVSLSHSLKKPRIDTPAKTLNMEKS